MPSELKILRTSISGGYSQPLNARSNIWEVQLPHPILPAFVSVLFEGQMASQSANWWDQSLRLPIPYLEDCRVREIWWQLSVDARFGSAGEVAPLSEPQNLERRPLAEGALDRLRTLVTSLRLATVYLPALTERRSIGWKTGASVGRLPRRNSFRNMCVLPLLRVGPIVSMPSFETKSLSLSSRGR